MKKDYNGKFSPLSIAALICSIICCGFVGIILAIIDLTKKDGRRRELSIAAIVIGTILLIVSIVTFNNRKNNEPKIDELSTAAIETSIEEEQIKETEAVTEASDVIIPTTTEVNLDYSSNDESTEESEKTEEELYFKQVKDEVKWHMKPRDECSNITLEDRTLKLEIFLTSTDKLLEQYTSISNAILAIDSGYDWWDTLVIDFGGIGVVTKTKDDLVDGQFEITKDDFIKE